jgi:hypothetical protein
MRERKFLIADFPETLFELAESLTPTGKTVLVRVDSASSAFRSLAESRAPPAYAIR